MQEAYRPPRSKYSICYPIPGGTPSLSGVGVGWGSPSWPGGTSSLAGGTSSWGTPILTCPVGTPFWGTPCWDWGTPICGWIIAPSHWGNPQEGTWDQSVGYPQKAHRTSGSIMGWRWGTPPRCEQTDTCENSTFPSYYIRGR